MTRNNLIILSLFFSLVIIASAVVLAQELAPVTFPVKELGNCRNFKECANFCDRPQNAKICTEFAEAKGMIMPEEAQMAKRMLDATAMGGPGGCKNEDECKSYCDDISHIEECVVFAEQNGFMSPEELKEAKAATGAIKRGINPPGNCKSKKKCEVYCDELAHFEECIAFAETAGFIPPEEAKIARKTGGKGPGNCRGKAQCDAYCNLPENMEMCMNFAIEHDLIPSEERENALKALEAMKKGIRPPNCRGREECDKYCGQPEHMEECTEFAIAAGFIPPEEAENVRRMAKTGIMGGGPGGCKGKDACEAYCDDLSHMTECVDFAERAGFMKPEEAARARRMAERGINVMNGGPGGCKSQEECESFCKDPANAETCFNFAVQIGEMTPEEAERARQGMRMMREGGGGPGGCKNEEECRAYCDDPAHQEECFKFSRENNLISPEELERMERGKEMMDQGGPGGCRGSQECEVYCREHGEECMKWGQERGFAPPIRGGGCGWCGDSCVKMETEMICPTVMPPRESICVEENGNCIVKQVSEGGPPPGYEGMKPSESMGLPPGFEGRKPPEGYIPSSPESYQKPPEGYNIPPPGGYTPPPATIEPIAPPSLSPPTTEQLPPTSFRKESLLGNILKSILDIFR